MLTRTSLTLLALASLLLLFIKPCHAQNAASPVSFNFDFRNGALGWEADFADYSPGTNETGIYELEAGIRDLPPEIQGGGTAFYMHGANRSDDLFMFLKRRLTSADGIVAGQAYQLTFILTLASNASDECAGIGGHPGTGVFLKTGGSPAEPLALLDESRPFKQLRMNVEKGNQAVGGTAASVAGDISTTQPCLLSDTPYVTITRSHLHPTPMLANAQGELWLLVGTDSGFEGKTGLYYQSISVSLKPVATPAPVLLTDSSTGRAAAVDSVNLTRDPFPMVNTLNFSPDQRTRVALFGYNMELRAGEDASVITAQAVDAAQGVHQLPVEHVGRVPSFEWITEVVVRLPDELKNGTEVQVGLSLRGVSSNRAPMRLKP
jgi:hypothetical protein